LSAPADFITSSYMALLPLWLSSKVKEWENKRNQYICRTQVCFPARATFKKE
jgi:hypothetical protein